MLLIRSQIWIFFFIVTSPTLIKVTKRACFCGLLMSLVLEAENYKLNENGDIFSLSYERPIIFIRSSCCLGYILLHFV